VSLNGNILKVVNIKWPVVDNVQAYDIICTSGKLYSDALQMDNPSEANDEGITALHNSICAGHFDIVKFLVEFGCDVNAADTDGWSVYLRLIFKNYTCTSLTKL